MTQPNIQPNIQSSSTGSPQGLSLVRAPIPAFEGSSVESAIMQISGTASVETNDDVLVAIDDRVRLVGEFRVTGVRFEVGSDGSVVRKHVLKPITVSLCPWDPTDPTDDGIVRMHPGHTP